MNEIDQVSLGYIVFCSCRRECGNHGLRLIVQGLKDPKFVIWRIENFIHHMKVSSAIVLSTLRSKIAGKK